MCRITVEHETRTVECGRSVLYQKRYQGVLKQDGSVQLLSYLGKRIPLTKVQAAPTSTGKAGNTKAAA